MLQLELEWALNQATENKRIYPQELTSALEEERSGGRQKRKLLSKKMHKAEDLNFRYSLC